VNPAPATDVRVLFDATSIPRNRAGVGRYVDGLLGAFALDRHRIDLVVVAKPVDVAGFRSLGLETVAAPPRTASTWQRLVWEQFGLPGLAVRLGCSVIHSPHYTFPLFSRLRRVVTLHDLTFFTMPEVHTRVKAPMFRWWIRRVARTRKRVVSVSRATSDEFIRIVGGDPGLVTIAHHGFDRAVFHPPTAEEMRTFASNHGVETGNWIAFLGTLEPRKNVRALVAAYAAVATQESAAGRSAPPLLLAGSEGWGAGIANELSSAAAAGADIRTLGYLPVDDLRAFLGGARVVAYPSLGEGFGLPVLEAMASGATVLTTRALSLPEVGGDAVAYSDTDAASIAAALGALLADADERERLAAAGIERAAAFTWDASAAAHAQAYQLA
jgi:glycosyltransferase involved in cell wall biosynthesis